MDLESRARINAMRAFLHQFDYEGKDAAAVVFAADPKLVGRARDALTD